MSLPRHMATVLIGGALLLPASGVEAQDRTATRAVPLEVFTVSGKDSTSGTGPGVDSSH
jgi:hypothetical protein